MEEGWSEVEEERGEGNSRMGGKICEEWGGIMEVFNISDVWLIKFLYTYFPSYLVH